MTFRQHFSAIAAIIIFSVGIPFSVQAGFDPKTLPPDLQWVSVKDIPIVYSDQGKGDPLFILSPYPFSTRLWTELANRLSTFTRVIVVEPPGLRAPYSMDGDFSTIHLLYIYRDFVKTLGFRKIHIMGVGEAGGLAVAFGHHFPENTTAVISIGGFESVHWTQEFETTMNYFGQSTEGALSTLLSIGSIRYRERPPSNEEMDGLLVPLPKEEQRKAVHARIQAFIQDVKASIILAMLPNMNRPVLLLRADGDDLLPEEYIQRTRTQIRKARVRYQVIKKAGHFAFLDQPQKVSELIETFLSDYPVSQQ